MKAWTKFKEEAQLLTFHRYKEFGLSTTNITGFLLISLAMYIFESFGFVMFLPLIEYVQHGRDLSILEGNSPLWGYIHKAFNAVHCDVTLLGLMSVIAFFMTVRIITGYVKQTSAQWLAQNASHHIRMRLVDVLFKTDYGLFTKSSTGKTINIFIMEAYAAANSINSRLTFITTFIALAVYSISMIAVSLPLTLLVFALIVMSTAITAFTTRSTQQLSLEVTNANNRVAFSLVEHLGMFRLHKLTATEGEACRKINENSIVARNIGYRAKRLTALIDVIYDPVVIIAILIIFYVGVEVFKTGLAGIGIFLVLLFRLLPLSKMLVLTRQVINSSAGSLDIVFKTIDEAVAHPDIKGRGIPLQGLKQAIQFRGVSYAYPQQRGCAVDAIDLTIEAGRMTAIVGPSGAGKTTLVDLLPLLRIPQHGEILFDGVPSQNFNTVSLRKAIAFCSQDTFVFNDTIRANLAIARPTVTDAEIWQALEKVQMVNHVRTLPLGLDTALGERGVLLSGGQKQRLGLARVLIQNAPILVLDEPTSSLDSEIEESIRQVLHLMRNERKTTIIVIAHRFSTIRNADKIVVIKDGKLVGQGTHKELAETQHWYAMVNELQLT